MADGLRDPTGRDLARMLAAAQQESKVRWACSTKAAFGIANTGAQTPRGKAGAKWLYQQPV